MAFNNRNNPSDLMIEDAKLLFTNFAGSPTRYNSEGGKREFSVALPLNLVEDLERDGWNVKFRKNADGSSTPSVLTSASRCPISLELPPSGLLLEGESS